MQKAFTLIELSIVLVIIGLIVGGVLVGQDLIRAAENRAVVSAQQSIKTAINTFRLKYNGLPGDITNAVTFWGVVSGVCMTTIGTGTQTCNGDGDKIIDGHFAPDNINWESWRAWQHLGNAGLIEGSYTGVHDLTCSAASRCEIPGTNVPKGPHNGSMWQLFIRRQGTNTAVKDGNKLIYSAVHGNGRWYGKVLTPLDALSIDEKIDDGMPFTGKVSGFSGGSYIPDCTTPGNSAVTDTYDVATSNKECLLYFDYD